MDEYIRAAEFASAEGSADWRVIGDGACAFYRTNSLAEAARLVSAIAALQGVEDHPPDFDIRPDGVTIRLLTRTADYYGMSRRDVDLAAKISATARSMGLVADPSAVQSVLVIPGGKDIAALMPFWQAILGYERRADSADQDLLDPRGRGPGFWFETMDELRPDGGGTVHVAVWVPAEQGEQRVAAALAAGGRMVSDEYAPSWWTLADPAGNVADVSTIRAREES